MTLRKLPSLTQAFGAELGMSADAVARSQVLELFWPEAFESTQGKAVMPAEDAQQLEELFERFGVPLKVAENSLKTLSWAYDVFCLGLGPFVRLYLRHPQGFGPFVADWSPDWVEYVMAVGDANLGRARDLAIKLQPLAPECAYPAGVRVDMANPQ